MRNVKRQIRVLPIILAILAVAIIFFIWYCAHPALNLTSGGFWLTIGGSFLVLAAYSGVIWLMDNCSDTYDGVFTRVHRIILISTVVIGFVLLFLDHFETYFQFFA